MRSFRVEPAGGQDVSPYTNTGFGALRPQDLRIFRTNYPGGHHCERVECTVRIATGQRYLMVTCGHGRQRPTEYRPNTHARHYESYEGVDAHRIPEMEEQPRWRQHERQRHSPSPRDHDQMPTSSSRQEVEIGLLDWINMEEAVNRERGRGRSPSDTIRGGPNPRRRRWGASSS